MSFYVFFLCFDNFAASKKQLADFISSLHGHIASLLRHMVGSLGMLWTIFASAIELFYEFMLSKSN